MQYTQIRISRTYNTQHYTSMAFALEADLFEDEPVEDALRLLADELDTMACRVMRERGIVIMHDGATLRNLGALGAASGSADDDIPF